MEQTGFVAMFDCIARYHDDIEIAKYHIDSFYALAILQSVNQRLLFYPIRSWPIFSLFCYPLRAALSIPSGLLVLPEESTPR